MQLTLIKKNKLSVFILPEKVSGSYWITDFENGKKLNLLSVEEYEGKWRLVSNQDAFVVDSNNVMVPYSDVSNYNFKLIQNNYKNEKYYLYASPVYDTTYKELGIKSDQEVKVGSSSDADVVFTLNGFSENAFTIKKKDKYFYLDVNEKASVYVNQKRVLTSKRLEYGDVIFTFGLKIILMRKDGLDYLLVNNPNNLVQFSASFVNVVPVKSDFVDDHTELTLDNQYNEENYFYRTPHFYEVVNKFVLNIDTPPSKKEEDKTPVALTIGPMITMAMTSVVMLMSNLSSISKGEKSASSSVTSLVMCGAMLASALLWPLLTRAYQKYADKMYEKKRQKLYKNYIDKKEEEINRELDKQRTTLLSNNFSVTDCQNVIRGHNVKLWQKRLNDEDFLNLPIGRGDLPMQIEIKYPEEHFTLSEDNLLDIAHSLGKTERILKDVPINFSFYNNVTTGIVGDATITKEFADRLLLQIMANYSYDEVKTVTFTSIDNEKDWEYMKPLPHSWSNDKSFRFFGSSNDDYREIVYNLEKIFNERRKVKEDGTGKFTPHYVIITDAIKSIDSYDFIKNVMSSNENYGFSIIILADKLSALPNECKNFINVSRNECNIFSSVINNSNQKFTIDFSSTDEIYNCAKELSNIPIDIKSEAQNNLPDVYHFLEMYQVGKVEQLNSKERWKRSNPILSLQAPVGIGKSGEVITLDLHEKYHGPHGLVAGTTGSGKSEFIISYILSLAINYHPYEVQFILIDYKGGSLTGSFANDRYYLPHLVGVITNLDGNELNRSLASIESEVKRRQKLFNEAKRVANESTMDIYKYQRLWREGRLKDMEPVSHLFIISDEFAELKEQQPDFMDSLISVARVGRSLGIHSILATQKPGGVVDSQIWSNTRFRVCLMVQDTSDSNEMLKRPDAAYLKKRGRFYLQVGTNEVFTLGQSSWSGGQYIPSNTFKKDVDTTVNEINNIGFVTTTKEAEVVQTAESLGEELPNIVTYLCDVAKNENVKVRKLWLDKIPANIFIDNLKVKYNYEKKDFYLDPIIGEYDDPENQNQFKLTIPFSKIGNAIVYGITGSGKEDFISSLLYSSMCTYTPEEVNFYVLDFGSESLKIFNKSPYVGDVAFVSDTDKVNNLFKMLNNELVSRKNLFSEYGGSYQKYIESNNKKMPNIVVIINNYESFNENFEDKIDVLSQLSREAYKYGIYFVITASNDSSVRMKTKNNFALIYALQQNNPSDYANILGSTRGKVPAKIKGRGLFKRDNIYEFQTAKVTDENFTEYIIKYMNELVSKYPNYKAKRIPVLPAVVDFESIRTEEFNGPNMVVGISKNTLEVLKYNYSKNPINLVSSNDVESAYKFINALGKEVIYTKQFNLTIINTTEKEFNDGEFKGRVFNNKFSEIVTKLSEHVDKIYEIGEKNNFNEDLLKGYKKNFVIIYGFYSFISKLSDETKKEFTSMLSKNNKFTSIIFVFVENPSSMKSYSLDEWFKSGTDLGRGIWIGSGVTDQSLFRISRVTSEDREEISDDFGYLVNNFKMTKIKLLTSFDVSDDIEEIESL